MWNVILSGLITVAAADVDLRTLDGQGARGNLVGLDGEHVVVETTEGRQSLSVKSLMSLRSAGVVRSTEPLPVVIELVDGSTCRATDCVVREGRLELTRPCGPAELAAGDIRSVRFAETSDTLLKEWTTLSATASDSDRLILVREESLNYHAGIVRGISADRVEFDLDGEVLRVKRSNVLGVIYHRAAGRELPPTVATLVDTTGSRWAIRSLSFEAGVFRATIPAGTTLELPADQVVEVDFSEGKVTYLGELPWRLIEWTPYFGLREELPARKAFFAPRFDRSAAGAPLMLDGQQYARGVTLRSRSEIEFDLPEGYRRFKAGVGIDDAFRPHGDARVVVRGDDRVLAETHPAGTRPAEWIDVDITGVRRLSILVDFGEDMDLGDQVNCCEARIVK